ncbi:MAG: hypothetical protein J6X57_02690 [Bacteroidales bacterium]|nr:hypothetical protein [Bacteroidales bacterium]
MKKNRFLDKFEITILALAGAFALTCCQKIEETAIEENTEAVEQESSTTYSITIRAERIPGPGEDEGTSTKGLEIGDGTEATTTLLKSVWKNNESVIVYLGSLIIGTLSVLPDAGDPHVATLYGKISNSSNIEAGVTTLTLLTPRSTWAYTMQTGKLMQVSGSIEKDYNYTMASSVLVTSVDVGKDIITTEDAHFAHQQSIYRMSFRYNDGVSKTPITTSSVTISSANGHLVQREVVGGAPTEGDITVSLPSASVDPFFVALRNGDETNAEALTFTVVDNSGVTYRGTKVIPAEYKPNGTFVSMKNASLTERLDIPLSATEVNTVL